jgi:hypothetical protein
MPTSNKRTGQVKFIQYHQPALKDGKYQITVTQKIESRKITTNNEFTTHEKTFYVAGERFTLNPQEIQAVFPPAGSLGEHSNVLPHIILNRSTLPWERTVDGSSKDIPWLALLLFEESEKPEAKVLTLKKLKDSTAKFPRFELVGQHEDDKVTVIDVPKSLLETILPTKSDLKYLAHVRQGTDEQGNKEGNEFAIIIGNRLPKKEDKSKSGESIVHLVSLEERYQGETFNYQGASNDDLIRLVSLKNWRFTCQDEKQSFKGLLENLNRNPSTLRLPTNHNPDAEAYLKKGYVPQPHYLRQGAKTISWYHSPLATGEHTTDLTLPVRAADQLVRYNPVNGLFDVSYAAAWELGRLLALQNKGFSVSLYQWKRTHVQQLRKSESETLHAPPHLPTKPAAQSTQLPKSIESWFNDLHLLKGVPFNYLVPDERMLPKESIRFFWMDNLWMECLLDGAFSIGRVTTSDHQRDKAHKENQTTPAAPPCDKVTGFLLRSDVVAGWPGLQVDGYDTVVSNQSTIPDSNKLELLRMDRLSANVLLCLFKCEAKTVDIHQKPEMLHFGVNLKDDDSTYYKELRDRQGTEQGYKVDVPLDDKRVVNINRLTQNIKIQYDSHQSQVAWGNNPTSAQFALQMIEKVKKVRFVERI